MGGGNKKVTVKARVSRKPKVMVAVPKKRNRKAKSKRSTGGDGNLLGQIGLMAGSMYGGPAGGALGMAAGKLISKITGFGEYKVQRNTVSEGNSVPTFTNGGDGMRVCHREFLSDVTGSVGFVNKVYPIQPGLVASFPWVSLLAADFEEYNMQGLVYEYRPSSGSAVSSTSSALGVVILATDYDVTNPLFLTKQQMESYEYSTSTVPFTGCIHPVECSPKLSVLNSQFIRTGAVPAGADARFFDLGNFQIATQGMQTAYTVGELWVSYDIVFRKPRLPPSIQLPAYTRIRESPLNTTQTGKTFGTNNGRVYTDSSLTVSIVDANTLLFPAPGNYVMLVRLRGSTAPSITLNPGGNINLLSGPPIYFDSTVPAYSVANSLDINYGYSFSVSSPGTSSLNNLIFSTVCGPSGNLDVMIFLLNRALDLNSVSGEMPSPFTWIDRTERARDSLRRFSLSSVEEGKFD